MSRFFSALRKTPFGPQSLRSQGVNVENVKPIYYSGRMAWWARWTYFLVAADLITVATMCELSWNHWTIWEELPKDTSNTSPSSSSNEKAGDVSDVMGHYVLRPWWQRGIFAGTTFVTGIGLGAILLGSRSRVVRRMFIIPNPSSTRSAPNVSAAERLVVIQSPVHTRHQGAVFPLRRTRLVQSADNTEMMVGLKDRRGHYSLGLEGAEVVGEKMSLWDARKALFKEWYGEKKGAQMFLNSSRAKETV